MTHEPNDTMSFSAKQKVVIFIMLAHIAANCWLFLEAGKKISHDWASLMSFANVASYIVFGFFFVALCLNLRLKYSLALPLALLSLAIAFLGGLSNLELAFLFSVMPIEKIGTLLYMPILNVFVALLGILTLRSLFIAMNEDAGFDIPHRHGCA